MVERKDKYDKSPPWLYFQPLRSSPVVVFVLYHIATQFLSTISIYDVAQHLLCLSCPTSIGKRGSTNLQQWTRLVKSKQCLNFSVVIGFVIMSASLSLIWTFINFILPSSIKSRIQWYLTSMCLVLEW